MPGESSLMPRQPVADADAQAASAAHCAVHRIEIALCEAAGLAPCWSTWVPITPCKAIFLFHWIGP